MRQGPSAPTRPTAAPPGSPRSASIPTWSRIAKEALAGSGVQVASVATAFPAGRAALPVKLADTADAVAAGADEIDMVIDRGAFLSGRYLEVFEEIRAVKRACARPDGTAAHLKVIFENGELSTYDNIRRAPGWRCWPAPTSSRPRPARSAVNATPPNTLLMLEAVRDFRAHDRRAGRREAGRRHPHLQGRDQVPGDGQRDGGRGLAAARTGSASVPPACSTTC